MRHSTSAAIDTPTIEGIASKPGTRGLAESLRLMAVALVAGVGAVGSVADEDENAD